MRQSVAAVIVLVLGGIGVINCSSSSSQATASSPTSPATRVTPNVSVQETTKGTRIFGPQLELVRDDKGIRGTSPMGAVELSEEKDGYSGLIGAGTTQLHVQPTSGGNFNIRGTFAGTPGDLQVNSDRIQGQLGPCQYDLRAAPSGQGSRAYSGERRCGTGEETTSLTLTPQIVALDPIDRGAMIAIILGQQ